MSLDPDFCPIPDSGIKKATDPASGSATLQNADFYAISNV
jgi:hypothetical protein